MGITSCTEMSCCRENIMKEQQKIVQKNEMEENQNILKSDFIDFYTLLGPDNIALNFETLQKKMTNNETKKDKNKILSTKLGLFKNDFDFWVEFCEQPNSSNKIHKYYMEIEYPFTAEFCFLFALNTNPVDINDSLDKYEILNYTIKPDIIVLVCRSTTKKILVIQPRNFILIRVIKKNEDGSFEEYQKSIELTNLRDKDGVEEYLKTFENVGTIFFNATKIFKQDDPKNDWMMIQSHEVDVLSSTGLTLVKAFMKKRTEKLNNDILVKMTEYLITNRSFDNLLWFTKDKNDIKRIFNENLEILKKKKIDLKNINFEAQSSFVDWINDQDNTSNSSKH
jgi:hypothetical protein